MNDLFLVAGKNTYSYQSLIADLNRIQTGQRYVSSPTNHPYEVFLAIVHSLVHDYEIELLDGELSASELLAQGVDQDSLRETVPINTSRTVGNLTELFERIRGSTSWKLTLYTSGTTGRPKKVTHNLITLSRNVVVSEKHASDVWVLAFLPTHMAGLQVFLQAFMNRNPLIYAFGEDMTRLSELLRQHQVTHISATPTYYRTALQLLTGEYPSVRSVAYGGEGFDSVLHTNMTSLFPQARFRNIYASTETGSLLIGNGEWVKIPEGLKPFIAIQQGELMVHRSLLGYMHAREEEADWFATGDLVEQVGEDRIRIVSRKSDFINTGGNKVNPLEVEAVLREVPGVQDVCVKGKPNSILGQIVVAEIVIGEGEDGPVIKHRAKHYAVERLQQWKVPRMIYIVPHMEPSRTGKKVRQ